MTRSASEEIRVSIMHLAPDYFLTPILVIASVTITTHLSFVGVAGLASGDSGLHGNLRIEEGTFQVQGLEDFTARQLSQTLPCYFFQEQAENDESQIAIDYARSGLVLQIQIRNRRKSPVRSAWAKQVERAPGGQA